MPPPRKKSTKSSHKGYFAILDPLLKELNISSLKKLIFSPSHAWIAAIVLLVVELCVNIVVIHKVNYTEIDWVAYMQEVEGVINGTMDYSKLRGDTGPLVYPAGFVWLYMGLYYITSQGTNIMLAQYIFAILYVINLGLVFRILVRTRKVPPYILVLMSVTSYRIHSIFVLRLFNDPVAVILLYAAINLFMDDMWSLGSVFFSLAVSVKMNILLYAPALLLAYLAVLGLPGTLVQLTICAGLQLILAAPFLINFPLEYIIGAFNLGRVFLFEWTVNFRFLPEEVFVSRWFHLALLVLHIMSLAYCGHYWWQYLTVYKKLANVDVPHCEQLLVLPLFMCNFIGIMFARSLHYQFYVWYYHTLHYLVWTTGYPVKHRLLLLGIIEMCWNTFPSTVGSSVALHVSHFVILVGLLSQVSKSCDMTIFTSRGDRHREEKSK